MDVTSLLISLSVLIVFWRFSFHQYWLGCLHVPLSASLFRVLCISNSFICFEICSIFVFPSRQKLRWGSQGKKFIWDIIPGSTGGRVGAGDGKGNEPIKAITAPLWATWSLWSLACFPRGGMKQVKLDPLSTHHFVKGYCWGHTSLVLLFGISLRSRVLPCQKDAPRQENCRRSRSASWVETRLQRGRVNGLQPHHVA